MQIVPANTVKNIKPYFFASLNKTINELKANGMEIIRLDMGSPDLPPADFIVDQLVESARDPRKHGYAPAGGTLSFLNTAAAFYQRRFGVTVDPKTQVVALIGSKEGIFNINHTLLNPGDTVLLPDPYYPVYIAGAQLADAQIHFMPLLSENDFLPDFSAIPADVARKAKMMWLNYPNNPTGAIADLDFFREAVDFARENEIVIAHDAPYTDVTFGDFVAPSILQVDGAMDVCVEFNSLSKTYNMAGWRVGFAIGNPEIIKYLATYKSQIDSSLFVPVMDAAETAMNSDQGWIHDRNKIYEERRDAVYEGLKAAGFALELPKAALYIWAKLPQGFSDATAFCDQVLRATGVSMTPGVVYGPSGTDFIRISIITPTEQIRRAMDKVMEWVAGQRKAA